MYKNNKMLEQIYDRKLTLHHAVQFIDECMLNLLLQDGADITKKNEAGLTPVHLAFAYFSDKTRRTPHQIVAYKQMINQMLSVRRKVIKNCTDYYGISHFHIACTIPSNEDVVRQFIANGISLDIKISDKSENIPGCTPLHCAAIFGNIEVVKLLLKHKPNINAKNFHGQTPLHIAWNCYCAEKTDQNYSMLKSLLAVLEENCENCVDKTGLSHFYIACKMNSVKVVENLVRNRKIDINAKTIYDPEDSKTYRPLHLAIKLTQRDIVELLLKYNANVDVLVHGKRNETSLHLACYAIYAHIMEVFDAICSHKSNIRYYNNSDRVDDIVHHYLTDECKYKLSLNWHLEIVNLLLMYKSDVNAKDCFKNPLVFGLCKPDINMFKKYQLPNNKEKFKLTFLRAINQIYSKSLSNRMRTVKKFLIYGFDIKIQDVNGNSLLHLLVEHDLCPYELTEAIDYILKRRILVNAPNHEGRTPIFNAILASNVEYFNLLLKHDADVNHVDSEHNYTPLHLAVMCSDENDNNYTKIVESLIKHGANIKAKDGDGSTPAHIACTRNSEIFKILLQNGANINVRDDYSNTVLHKLNTFFKKFDSPMKIHLWKIIESHVFKLRGLNTKKKNFISKNSIALFKRLKKRIPFNETTETVLEQCSAELVRMKKINLESSSTLYDVLYKSLNEMAIFVNNVELKKNLSSREFHTDFPIYGYLLKLQYRRGTQRDSMLGLARTVLSSLIREELPEACLNNILHFFDNHELSEFLKVESEFKVQCDKKKRTV